MEFDGTTHTEGYRRQTVAHMTSPLFRDPQHAIDLFRQGYNDQKALFQRGSAVEAFKKVWAGLMMSTLCFVGAEGTYSSSFLSFPIS